MSDEGRFNELGQPIGPALEGWSRRRLPGREPIEGRYCRLEAMEPSRHAEDLWEAIGADPTGSLFTYLFSGPFDSIEAFRSWLVSFCSGDDPLFYAILEVESRKAAGFASYQRMEPEMGTIEVASILYTPRLRHTAAATEAMYLMMRRAFSELGYRRYEWKCDSLNAPSRRAAERLGFTFEGIHRQAIVYKGRSRDTAWYSILDSEWPAVEEALVGWLDAANFDSDGRQRSSLGDFRR